jgi:hypothetical protein
MAATLLIGLAAQANATVATSRCRQNLTASVKNANLLIATFQNPPLAEDTIVVGVVYTNSQNTGNITVNGMGLNWTASLVTPYQSGLGIAFFYAAGAPGNQASFTVTGATSDKMVVFAEDWGGLYGLEDPGSRAYASGTGAVQTVTGTTANSNDVIINIVAYAQNAKASVPSGNFLSMGVGEGAYSPYTVGGYEITSSAGAYSNTFTTSTGVPWLSAAVALESSGPNTFFNATPLTDFTSNQLYLNKFPGFLYNQSNTPDPQHDADGKAFAGQIQPLDTLGNPSSSGVIVAAGIGISNLTEEMCTGNNTLSTCDPSTFIDQVTKYSNVNPRLIVADCGVSAAYAADWTNPLSAGWTTCLSRLATYYGVTPAQVQVVIFEAGEKNPAVSLSGLKGSTCPPNPNPATDPDACVYEQTVAQVARLMKATFPNLKQIYLQTRIYAGWDTKEPFSYEIGFAQKWLIQAQVNQINHGTIDPLAGDLSYSSAAWIDWSTYTWVSGDTPRLDGQTWAGYNMQWDGVHPDQCRFYGIQCGSQHVADMMMGLFTVSPYTTPWFLK